MATVYPTTAGNWSTRTWNNDATGAAYGTTPQAGDTVLANGLAITLDQDITVLELKTTAGTTAAAGGSFTGSGTRIVNANIVAGTTTVMTIGSSTNVTLNGNVTGGSSLSAFGVSVSGVTACSLTLTGNVTGGSGSNAHGVSLTGSAGSVTITGSLTGAAGRALNITTGGARVTGNVTGGTANQSGIGQSGGRLVVVGDVTGGNGGLGISHSIGALAIFGNVIGGSSGNGWGISSTSGGVYIRGNVSAAGAVNGMGFSSNTTTADFCVVYGTVTGGSSTGIGITNSGAARVDIYGSTVDSGGNATSNTGSGSIVVTAVGGGGSSFRPSAIGSGGFSHV